MRRQACPWSSVLEQVEDLAFLVGCGQFARAFSLESQVGHARGARKLAEKPFAAFMGQAAAVASGRTKGSDDAWLGRLRIQRDF